MVTHCEDTADNAYEDGFCAGLLPYWVDTDWTSSMHVDEFWAGYEDGIQYFSKN